MKNYSLRILGAIVLLVVIGGTGCVPPPPHQHPAKLPAPPGGPSATVVHQNIDNLQG